METSRINDTIKKLYPKDFQTFRKKKPFFSLEENLPAVIVALCLMFIPLFVSTFYYNKFTGLYTDALTAQAQIRTYLQKRGNIVTNLTKMVVDYAEHEKTMYKYMADIRKDLVSSTDSLMSAAKSIDLSSVNDKEFSKFEGLLSKFMAWSENYPDLKLNQNFQDFMREIVAVEGNIADRRVEFNDKVNIYTSYRAKFPNKMFAWLFGFKSMDFYEGSKDFQRFQEVKY